MIPRGAALKHRIAEFGVASDTCEALHCSSRSDLARFKTRSPEIDLTRNDEPETKAKKKTDRHF